MSISDETTKGPRIFRLDPAGQQKTGQAVALSEEPDFLAVEAGQQADFENAQKAVANRRKLGWGAVLRSALSALASLWIGVYGWRFVEDLFQTNEILGWIALVVAIIAIFSALALLIREWRAISRLEDLSELRTTINSVIERDDHEAAVALVRHLNRLYRHDATSAAARAEMEAHCGEVIDGPDLLNIAERVLMRPRDAAVVAAIMTASRRVSLITAISPRAVIDVLFAGAQAVRLTRMIAQIYGSKPGLFGFLRLGRKVFTHLAITGGIAVTDGVLSQVLGHGLAARLSAKLGEGVLNGILTARVGLAAIAVCRPMPFIVEKEPKLADLVGGILRTEKSGS